MGWSPHPLLGPAGKKGTTAVFHGLRCLNYLDRDSYDYVPDWYSSCQPEEYESEGCTRVFMCCKEVGLCRVWLHLFNAGCKNNGTYITVVLIHNAVHFKLILSWNRPMLQSGACQHQLQGGKNLHQCGLPGSYCSYRFQWFGEISFLRLSTSLS